MGAICLSNSSWAVHILFVKKPDGSLNLCVDYWALNKVMIKDSYLLLQHKDLMDYLCGAEFFTLLDL